MLRLIFSQFLLGCCHFGNDPASGPPLSPLLYPSRPLVANSSKSIHVWHQTLTSTAFIEFEPVLMSAGVNKSFHLHTE